MKKWISNKQQMKTTIFIQLIMTQCVWMFLSLAELPDLPCKRSLGHLVTVLGSDTDLGIQTGPSEVQVDGGSSTNHL